MDVLNNVTTGPSARVRIRAVWTLLSRMIQPREGPSGALSSHLGRASRMRDAKTPIIGKPAGRCGRWFITWSTATSTPTDYLQWRGINVDIEVRRLIRKTIDLSSELRSVTALARSLYLSRRALGRRFLTNGLPVPSHWLHFGRVLRASLSLQSSGMTLAEAASRFGYPDGFALSNQMQRLVGVRPSDARRYLGWDWLVEAWIHTEAASGGFSSHMWGTLTKDFSLAPLRRAAVDSEADSEEEKETCTSSGPPPRPRKKQRSPVVSPLCQRT